jgi:cell fate (sporulation/competence/biofilm development) regulator YlbF (YheA/YmcA/DUF963 family)
MQLGAQTTPIIEKTKELCRTIVTQPEFETLIQRVEAFNNDFDAQLLYQKVSQMQDELVQRQRSGEQLAEEDIQTFETHRDELINHPTARNFLEAQQQISQVRQTITQYVTRTFELGRVPEENDFGACCGGGCSCGG